MDRSETARGAADTEASSHDELQADLAQAERQVAELRTALDSRVVIEQAKGVLRERFAWSVEEAFEVLRYAARSARMNIHALAAEVVAREVTPNPIVVAIARSARWRAAQMRERAELQRFRADQLETAVRDQQERLAWKQKERGRAHPSPEGRG
jgi:hypothetical protein